VPGGGGKDSPRGQKNSRGAAAAPCPFASGAYVFVHTSLYVIVLQAQDMRFRLLHFSLDYCFQQHNLANFV